MSLLGEAERMAKIVNGHKMVEDVQNDNGLWHYKSYRLYLILIMGLAILANTLVRATLSIGMVCMVNTTHATDGKNVTAVQSDCDVSDVAYDDYGGTMLWTSGDQSFLFSAIYWGGVLSCIPAGLFADRYSPKLLILCCFILQCLGCLLSPVTAIRGGVGPLFFVRFLMGAGGQAVFNPAITVLIARFVPPTERSTAIALYTGGNQIGLMVSMPLNAWLCKKKTFLGGWPSIFYMNALVMLLCMIPWMVFVADKPDQCRWISKSELRYIEKSLRLQNLGKKKGIFQRVPWLKMLSSMALWSCIMGNFAACIMVATLESYIPTYFKQALHLNLKSNGMLSALPYLAQWVSKILFAITADSLKTNARLSHTWICRLFNCLNTFAAGVFLIACGYMNCGQKALAITFLTLANFLSSGQVPGYFTSLVCIAPAYTGIVNAFARLSGQVASVIAPYIVGAITIEGTASEWRVVYYITAAALIITGVHFLVFGSAQVQPWTLINEHIPKVPLMDKAFMPGKQKKPVESFVALIDPEDDKTAAESV